MSSTDKLTPLLILLKEKVRQHDLSFALGHHITKSGIYAPDLDRRHPPQELVNIVKSIRDEIGRFETFEEFAVAIESTADLAFMESEPRGHYLFGGNFFIRIPAPPMLKITQAMIDSAIERRKHRDDKSKILDEGTTSVQLEKFISSEEQISLWTQGYSIHRTKVFCWLVNDHDKVIDVHHALKGAPQGSDGGECCPDFSCCSGQSGFPLEERKIFQRADESTRWQMLANALQQAFIDLGKESGDVHIAGSMTPPTLNS
jgi:hypothetical protein